MHDQTVQMMEQILINQGDLKERLARVETRQESFETQLHQFGEVNEAAHDQMVRLITDKAGRLEKRVQALEGGHTAHQTTLDKSVGVIGVVKWGIGIIATLLTGGLAVKLIESFVMGK